MKDKDRLKLIRRAIRQAEKLDALMRLIDKDWYAEEPSDTLKSVQEGLTMERIKLAASLYPVRTEYANAVPM